MSSTKGRVGFRIDGSFPGLIFLSTVLRWVRDGYDIDFKLTETYKVQGEVMKAQRIRTNVLEEACSFLAERVHSGAIPIYGMQSKLLLQGTVLDRLVTRLRNVEGESNLSGLLEDGGEEYYIGGLELYQAILNSVPKITNRNRSIEDKFKRWGSLWLNLESVAPMAWRESSAGAKRIDAVQQGDNAESDIPPQTRAALAETSEQAAHTEIRHKLRKNSLDAPIEKAIKQADMAAKSAGLGFDDFHTWSASGGNYASERDCLSVWKSFNESGPVTANSLYAMAFAQGWQDPAKRLQAANGSRTNFPIAAPRKTPVTPITQAESAKAAEVWSRCEPAPANHAYIARKAGLPNGLRIYPDGAPPLVIRGENVAGWLVVPCNDLDGNLQTLQFIPSKGDKLNLPGASFGHGCHVVGEIGDRVYVVEGIGQAWACHAATGAAAVVCFGAGRMAKVAAAIRAKHPVARLVLVPDRGKEVQAAEIARAVKGAWCELPADKAANYDANDYACEHGTDALAELLARTKEPPKPEPRFKLLGSADLHALANPRTRGRQAIDYKALLNLLRPILAFVATPQNRGSGLHSLNWVTQRLHESRKAKSPTLWAGLSA